MNQWTSIGALKSINLKFSFFFFNLYVPIIVYFQYYIVLVSVLHCVGFSVPHGGYSVFPIFPVLLGHVPKRRHCFLRPFSWLETLRMGRIEFVSGYFQSIHHYHNPWKSFKMRIQ